jgi:PAS domain S-box-containing protein
MYTHSPSEHDQALDHRQRDAERLLFQAILDNSPLGIWMLGTNNRLKFVNKTFCNALGISEQEFLAAKHYVDVLPSLVSASCIKSDRECYEQETPHLSTEWLPFVDGKDHLLEITRVKLFDHEGRITGLIGLAADITERKRAEERQRLTAKVFENTQEGITITDVSGNVVEVNEAFCRTTEYPREELLGQNMRILQSGHQSPSFYEDMWKSIITT